MKTARTHNVFHEEQRWFYVALCILVISFLSYIYFVSASVVHVVVRKEIDRDIAAQASVVSELEASYIEAQHSVSSDIANHHGFVAVTHKTYIDTRDTTLVFNSN